MLIWCLKQFKDFILKFTIGESFFSDKRIIEFVYYTLFFCKHTGKLGWKLNMLKNFPIGA